MQKFQLVSMLCASFLIGLTISQGAQARLLHKRSFLQMGCKGEFVPSFFARLDRVCEECFQMYRKPFIFDSCRSDCYRNETFLLCTEALMLHKEKDMLESMVNQLYGPIP
ncbi:crustacean hyperglycemic hormone-like [Varroa jacobsoni]|uniref:Crustacean hyperglycemic hormone n=1 Tax=Varroa destructor TaxID=109461 RepID=A0A7M7JXX9_VARDE|nr:crustacean hyperglycemic hormone-like [Varroa destructor]XP_022700961.1 crustacean hyperglycemic hormone-like [Varroa jacobsoni]